MRGYNLIALEGLMMFLAQNPEYLMKLVKIMGLERESFICFLENLLVFLLESLIIIIILYIYIFFTSFLTSFFSYVQIHLKKERERMK